MRLPCHSGGQALVLALFLLLVGAAALLQLFDAGQLVHEKTRLTHAADAAAYSGALVQARGLNFQAYANRAQVAHQVAMAHLVTLASWAKFGATEAGQAATGNPPTGVVGMLFGADHGAAYAASRQASGLGIAAQAHGSLGRAFAEHDSVVHEVLWRAQQAVAQQLVHDRQAAMQAVLQANYSGRAPLVGGAVLLDDVPLADALPGHLSIRNGQSRTRLREMVLQATDRYGFLGDRNDTARNPWAVSSRCPHRRHELRRRGTTRLEGFDTWSASDTQSYHALRSNRWIGCYHREYPMGWAMAATGGAVDTSLEHVADPPPDFSAEDFWRWATRNTVWNISRVPATRWPIRVRWQGRRPGVDAACRATWIWLSPAMPTDRCDSPSGSCAHRTARRPWGMPARSAPAPACSIHRPACPAA